MGEEKKDASPNGVDKKNTPEGEIHLYETLGLARESLLVLVGCLCQLLTQVGFGQTIFTSHIIGTSLGTTSPGQESWIVSAYSLTVGTFILPAGRLGDMYGHKLLVVVGSIWFGLFSILAGVSVFAPHGEGAVIMFSIMQGVRGIGPALLLPNALAILGRAYPNGPRKNIVFALFAMCAPTGAILGGVFGAIFAQQAWWPWAMWSIGIVLFCLAALAAAIIPADDKMDLSKDQQFDIIGAALGVSGLTLFNFSWNQAGVVGWPVAYNPVLLAVSIVLLVALAFYEGRVEQPIIPPALFTLGTAMTLVMLALGWASFGITVFYAISIIQNIRGYSTLSSVAQLSPFAPGGIVAALLTGVLISKVPSHWLMSFSAAAFTIAAAMFATTPVQQIYWSQTFVAGIFGPFGMDISFPAAALVLSNLVPRHLQGVAASLCTTIANYSISIGLGVASTVDREFRLQGKDLLLTYRAALYVGLGMAGSALVLSVCFGLFMQFFVNNVVEKPTAQNEYGEKNSEEIEKTTEV